LFFSATAYAQTYIAKANNGNDQTNILQAAFKEPSIRTIEINSSDIIINGTLNIPEGKTIKFENGIS